MIKNIVMSVVAMATLWLVVGCAGTQQARHSDVESTQSHQVTAVNGDPDQTQASAPYRLNVSDVIDVKFFYTPNLDETLTIRPDGKISLQLVGDVQAAGYTPMELKDILTQRYSVELKQPQIAIIAKGFSEFKVYVGGEVANPSVIPLSGSMTVLRAIINAGGFTDSAKTNNVIIIRKGKKKEALVQYLTVDMNAVLSNGDTEDEVLLNPFDIVYVPKTTIAKIGLFISQYIGQIIPGAAIQAYRDFRYINWLDNFRQPVIVNPPSE